MKKILFVLVFNSLMISFLLSADNFDFNNIQKTKNVILFIADGMSLPATTLARWYQGGKPLNLDPLACGLVRTYSSDSAIADSAPAATAFACGYKSHTGYIGILPDENSMPNLPVLEQKDKRKPIANVFESARLKGLSTGLVVTCELPHATPADFSAHSISRNNYDDISEQQVYSNMDVVLGGGANVLFKTRKDGEDLLKIVKKNYDYVTTPEEMNKAQGKKLFGMFADMDLKYDMDRDSNVQPSLEDMTEKAIQVLKNNPNGFILMVEASKIDWAAHANDPLGVISDVLALDRAVKKALDFAKNDKNTLVLIVSDHGNGGISIGNFSTTKDYDTQPLKEFISPLKAINMTGEGLGLLLNNCTYAMDIKNVLEQHNMKNVSDKESFDILNTVPTYNKGLVLDIAKQYPVFAYNKVLGPMMSVRSKIGWTTQGHTGEDVVFYCYAPYQNKPTGVFENTEINKIIANSLDLDLKATSDRLFMNAKDVCLNVKGIMKIDKRDIYNPILIIKSKKQKAEFPINKNYFVLNGKKIELIGVTISNGEDWFVCRDVLKFLK